MNKTLTENSLVNPQTIARPHAYYAAMREEAPVHFDENAQAYLVSRYQDIQQAARMVDELSNELGFAQALRPEWQDEVDELMTREGHGPHLTQDNFQVDPPLHARRRGLVDQAFSGLKVAAMENDIDGIVNELMDKIVDGGGVDMVERFTIPIAIYVISDLLGVPRDRLDDVKRWSDAAVAPLGMHTSREQGIAYARDLMEMHRFIVEQIADRKENPSDDLISKLVHARIDDDQSPVLEEKELLSCCVALLAAGNETTRNAMSWGIYMLAKDPELCARLRDSEDQNKDLKRFVEEVLRYDAPVPQLPRMAKVDCEIGGVKIPKGSAIFLCWASANRDQAKFTEASEFDAERKNAGQHLSFGAGIHRCVGAMLARMEMKLAFKAVVNRLENLQLEVTPDELDIWGTFVFRGPRSLPVTFSQRVAK